MPRFALFCWNWPLVTNVTVNTQNIGVKQSVDLVKLGVNYKFALSDPLVTRNRFS
jgi:hypothetical protein